MSLYVFCVAPLSLGVGVHIQPVKGASIGFAIFQQQ